MLSREQPYGQKKGTKRVVPLSLPSPTTGDGTKVPTGLAATRSETPRAQNVATTRENAERGNNQKERYTWQQPERTYNVVTTRENVNRGNNQKERESASMKGQSCREASRTCKAKLLRQACDCKHFVRPSTRHSPSPPSPLPDSVKGKEKKCSGASHSGKVRVDCQDNVAKIYFFCLRVDSEEEMLCLVGGGDMGGGGRWTNRTCWRVSPLSFTNDMMASMTAMKPAKALSSPCSVNTGLPARTPHALPINSQFSTNFRTCWRRIEKIFGISYKVGTQLHTARLLVSTSRARYKLVHVKSALTKSGPCETHVLAIPHQALGQTPLLLFKTRSCCHQLALSRASWDRSVAILACTFVSQYPKKSGNQRSGIKIKVIEEVR